MMEILAQHWLAMVIFVAVIALNELRLYIKYRPGKRENDFTGTLKHPGRKL